MIVKCRPFLKWAGNKYHCLEPILNLLPKGSRLIEPFAGSAVVFMNTAYPDSMLAEDNADLVRLYQCIQKEGSVFIDYCQKWFKEQYNNPDDYYRFRQQFNQMRPSRRKAALFLYLNRHGYNGLCRYNASGDYNVPFGRYIKPYFPYQEMLRFYQKSQQVALIHADFRKTFTLAQPDDVIYCDPPYVPLLQSSNFSSYTGKKFTEKEQFALIDCAIEAVKHGVTVIISNHDTPWTRQHYHAADITSFPVRRMINCKSNQRVPVQELLAVFHPK
jgi:DNA adenine methylase